jgi:hypothetical protein
MTVETEAIFKKLDIHTGDIHDLKTGHSNLMFRVVHLEKSKDEILLTMAANRAEMNKELASLSQKQDTLLAENYRAQGAANAVRWTQTGIQIIVGLAAVAAIIGKFSS